MPTMKLFGAISPKDNGFNFNHSILDRVGHVIPSNADLINRADLGIQAMHSPNAHNFPLLLAGFDVEQG